MFVCLHALPHKRNDYNLDEICWRPFVQSQKNSLVFNLCLSSKQKQKKQLLKKVWDFLQERSWAFLCLANVKNNVIKKREGRGGLCVNLRDVCSVESLIRTLILMSSNVIFLSFFVAASGNFWQTKLLNKKIIFGRFMFQHFNFIINVRNGCKFTRCLSGRVDGSVNYRVTGVDIQVVDGFSA